MNIKIVDNVKDANCITHGGIFHTDDVFATVILSKYLESIKLIRLNEIVENDAVFVYDIGNGEFDHHQVGGNGVRSNGVPYASCGLIWKKIGVEVLKKLEVPSPEEAFKIIDKDLIQFIDADDNGAFPKIETPYKYVSLATIISNFNVDDSNLNNKRFLDAVEIANIIFQNVVDKTIKKINAKEIFNCTIQKVEGSILVFDKSLPWKEFLLENGNPKNIDYVIIPSIRGGYNVLAVPISLTNRDLRKPFPKEWGGLRDQSLQEKTGIATFRFCHVNRFICVTETKEDAIKLAHLALELSKKE